MSQRIFPITMPKWGIEMQQGTITQWHAEPGQALAKGDTLLDVETEKIVNSVEAPIAGTLRRILADVGATESVGVLIAVFAAADVPEAEVDAFIAGFKPADTSFEPDGGEPVACRLQPAPATTPSRATAHGKVSPIARRLADKLGIDVTQIKGTGSHGRVSKEDVEAYAAALRRQRPGERRASAAPVAATVGSRCPCVNA